MDLQIGAHCELSTCKELDFLPIKCFACQLLFCRSHISPDIHECKAQKDAIQPPSQPSANLQHCSIDGCGKLALTPLDSNASIVPTCASCSKFFCPTHRYPDVHHCPLPVSDSSNQPSHAQTLIQQNFPRSSPSSSQLAPKTKVKAPPTDPVKLAAYKKVELIKLRHKAKPADPRDTSCPLDQRLHVKVSSNGLEKPFWIRKDMITGKAIDLFASQFKLPSHKRFQLLLLSVGAEQPCPLPNDQPIGHQVQDLSCLALLPTT